jgi:hypothetical protein
MRTSGRTANEERLLSVSEARWRLGGIGTTTFYRLARDLHLPLYRLGGKLTRVRERDLAALVATLPEGPLPSPNPRTRHVIGIEKVTAPSREQGSAPAQAGEHDANSFVL